MWDDMRDVKKDLMTMEPLLCNPKRIMKMVGCVCELDENKEEYKIAIVILYKTTTNKGCIRLKVV